MGNWSTKAEPAALLAANVPDRSLSVACTTDEELSKKHQLFGSLKSSYKPAPEDVSKNLIQVAYEEDFETIDHMQALRLPPLVVKELNNAVAGEAKRRCVDLEKVMARCLQDKMWTAWKCQKDRDAYYHCCMNKEKDTELLNELRWKYNLGTFHGEILARRNIMKRMWQEYYPERELPHPWAGD